MNGKTYPYLELAALGPVGSALLDPSPAFVFSGDGTRILWANAAGAAFFGERRMGDLLELELSGLNPLKAQVAKLARMLPTETSRLEILRIGKGVSLATLPAACRRLNLKGGSSAVFAIGAGGGPTESLSTRAERLADVIAGDACLVALIDRDGRVLGASGGYDELSPAEASIDALIDAAREAPNGLAKRLLTIGRDQRPAGAARVSTGAKEFFLLIVGPVEEHVAAPAPVPAEQPAPEIEPVAVAETMPSEPEPEPVPAPEPAVRFLFELDADHRFAFVSPELARLVGEASANVAGKPWDAVADALGIDPDGRIRGAIAAKRAWSAHVRWPADDSTTLGADLTAFPVPTGHRGFGLIHENDRRPDAIKNRKSLADIGVAAPEPPPAEPAESAEPPASEETPAVEAEPTPAVAKEASPPEQAEEPSPTPQAVEPPPPPGEELPLPVKAAEPELPPVALEPPAPPPKPRPPARPIIASADDLDDVARKMIEEGRAASPERGPIVRESEVQPSNVVRLPGAARTPPERLSGTEQDAFRRIAETLRLRKAEKASRPPDETPAEVQAESFADAATSSADVAVPATPKKEVAAPSPSQDIDTRLLDRVPLGLVIFRESKTLFANRALLDFAGYDSFFAFAEAGGADALFPSGDGGWADGIAETGGWLKARRRDGTAVAAEVRLNAVTWGGATALMLSIRPRVDLSGEADETLVAEFTAAQARAEELAAILDTATDGVIVVDRAGKIGSMNRAGEALFGIDASEYLGRPFTALLAEESHRPALDYLDGLASNGVASVLNDGREVIGRVPQGGLIPLFMTMGRIGDGEKFCAVLRDITHWKNVEEELVAARRAAETANAQKSDFLAKISHEIRTPLNAIIGFSEVMMEERFGPIGTERYRAYLKDIHVSGEHLMSLINDLLDLSKIEAGKLELSFEAVGVNTMIQECVALMQPQANRERIIIRTSLSADVPNVVADRRSLRQILLNLLSNAVKFTRAGGQVIVSSVDGDLGRGRRAHPRHRHRHVGEGHRDGAEAVPPARHRQGRRAARHRARPAADQGAGRGQPRRLRHRQRGRSGNAGEDHLPDDAGAGRVGAVIARYRARRSFWILPPMSSKVAIRSLTFCTS